MINNHLVQLVHIPHAQHSAANTSQSVTVKCDIGVTHTNNLKEMMCDSALSFNSFDNFFILEIIALFSSCHHSNFQI